MPDQSVPWQTSQAFILWGHWRGTVAGVTERVVNQLETRLALPAPPLFVEEVLTVHGSASGPGSEGESITASEAAIGSGKVETVFDAAQPTLELVGWQTLNTALLSVPLAPDYSRYTRLSNRHKPVGGLAFDTVAIGVKPDAV